MAGTWYVKLARGSWETVVGMADSKEEAEAEAAVWNTRYQTDEYYIEEWDEGKSFGSWTRGL